MKSLIHNIMDIGLGGLLLWALFIFIIAVGIDCIFCNMEKVLDIKRTARWYDVVVHLILVVIFIAGIYYYD